MQQDACKQKSLNGLPLLALVCLAGSASQSQAVFIRGASNDFPRGPSHVRIPPHALHAFSTWAKDPSVQEWMGSTADPNKPGTGKRVMNAINQYRAKICWEMKDAHGEKFSSFTKCKAFMERACRPGGDLSMDGDRKEMPTGKGYCKMYFPEDEQAAEEELEADEASDDAEDARAASADMGWSKIKEAAEAKVQAAKGNDAKEEGASGSAASTKDASGASGANAGAAAGGGAGGGAAGAPAAAGGDAAASPGAAASPAGAPAYPKNEAWYYKNGGKDASRFHMSEDMKLPTHGFHGRLVEHNDQKSMASDWENEFGDSDYDPICKKYPTNPWCLKKGYKQAEERSASLPLACSSAMVLLAFVCSF